MIDYWDVPKAAIIFKEEVTGYCALPYQDRQGKNHPKGCPNIGKCRHPQNAPSFINRAEKIYLFIGRITMDEHLAQNQRWYQPRLKTFIREEMIKIYSEGDYVLAAGSGTSFAGSHWFSMEAAKIHVFETLEGLGISIERNPVNYYTMVFLLAQMPKRSLLTWIKSDPKLFASPTK
jgi:hypothetical protein